MQTARMVTLPFILFELLSGYGCAIVNYIDRYLTRYELIVCMEWLEFPFEIVFNVSV